MRARDVVDAITTAGFLAALIFWGCVNWLVYGEWPRWEE